MISSNHTFDASMEGRYCGHPRDAMERQRFIPLRNGQIIDREEDSGRFINVTHAEPHESELGLDGIQKGFKTFGRLLKNRTSELEASLAGLDIEITPCHGAT
ncbi:uncharacterized protein L203_103371 [Cryptococcus depauperatus CBS 7841]|uniref:Uncharacterized protein n=1 Tax=Cryptococcus depauperatus CBS 7841 TaxID=1295531 RepID=A0A1E3I2M4_9TREE|nr:hypothetical protein L203_05404 [Cryptococcus depauperatus CBS 7841]